MVKNGVPGQKVRFSVNKVRSGRAEGRILEVLEKSSLECEPVCPHFADCGGCTYQNLPYETQLDLKKNQVKELLDQAVAPFGYEYEFEMCIRDRMMPTPPAFATAPASRERLTPTPMPP